MEKKIAILGGGVAGLIAALHLITRADKDSKLEITILEKEKKAGGLLNSTYSGQYWWDNGTFFFNESNYLVKKFPEIFKPVKNRSGKVRLHKKFYSFPFKPKNLACSLPFSTNLNFAIDYINYRLKRPSAKDKNLAQWFDARLPAKFMNWSNLAVYISKLQGVSPKKLSPKLGEKRLSYINKISNFSHLLRMLLKFNTRRKSRVFYPSKSGVGSIVQRLTKICEAEAVEIKFNSEIVSIDKKEQYFYIQCTTPNNTRETYKVSHIISTIPIDDFVNVFQKHLDPACLRLAENIKFRDLYLVFFAIKTPELAENHLTTYSFEPHHLWKRLYIHPLANNYSAVGVETAVNAGETFAPGHLLEQIEDNLVSELQLFKKNEISLRKVIRIKKAYPVLELGYDDKISTLIKNIESDTLRLAGRNGTFNYFNSSEAALSGIEAAEKLNL